MTTEGRERRDVAVERAETPSALPRLDLTVPIVAHLRGGPLDGSEHVMFRTRPVYLQRVRRGWVRRLLGRPGQHARYEVDSAWTEGGDTLQHGDYRFTGYVPATGATPP